MEHSNDFGAILSELQDPSCEVVYLSLSIQLRGDSTNSTQEASPWISICDLDFVLTKDDPWSLWTPEDLELQTFIDGLEEGDVMIPRSWGHSTLILPLSPSGEYHAVLIDGQMVLSKISLKEFASSMRRAIIQTVRELLETLYPIAKEMGASGIDWISDAIEIS